jgi:hypothetical protein
MDELRPNVRGNLLDVVCLGPPLAGLFGGFSR